MKQKNKSLLKNIGIFTIGSFGSNMVSFLMVPLYTSLLSTAEYGSVDLITSTASLLTPILLLSIQDATLRFGMDPAYKKEDVLSTSINILLKASMLLLFGLIVIRILKLFKMSTMYLIFLFIFFALGALNNILNIYLKAKGYVSAIAVSGFLCTLIACSSNILLLFVFKTGIIGYMISNTIGILVQIVFQLVVSKVYKDIHIRNYTNLSNQMIKYSSPLIANSISWWINNASDRYILTWLRGVSTNGIYTVSYKIPTILSVFQNIFFNAWSISAIAEFDEYDTDGFIGINYSMYSFISLVVCSCLLIINMPLSKILYRGDYYAAWQCVPFLLLGTVFCGISQFEGSLFAATRNTKQVAKTTVIGAAVNTICNFIFIYFIGAIGAALATLIGYAVTWALRTKKLQSFVRMKVNWCIHFVSLFLVVIQAIVATLNISLVAQIVILLVVLILNRKLVIPATNIIIKK